MTVCIKHDKSPHQKSVFYCKQRGRFIFRHLTTKKSYKRFTKEYIPDVRYLIYHKRNLLIMTFADSNIFKKILKTIMLEEIKNIRRNYLHLAITMMKL